MADQRINASGNRPPNVPRWTSNIWTSVSQIGGMPLELGGGLRFVGERQANTANDLQLQPYALVNLYSSYRLRGGLLLTARVNNAFRVSTSMLSEMNRTDPSAL